MWVSVINIPRIYYHYDTPRNKMKDWFRYHYITQPLAASPVVLQTPEHAQGKKFTKTQDLQINQ